MILFIGNCIFFLLLKYDINSLYTQDKIKQWYYMKKDIHKIKTCIEYKHIKYILLFDKIKFKKINAFGKK